MSGVLLLYTGAFLLYGVMEVLGLMPQELVSAGITLPRLFAKYLGDPDLDFMAYQLRRTTITTFVHLTLPLLYCIGMSMVEPQVYKYPPGSMWSVVVATVWLVSIACFLTGAGLAYYWYSGQWTRHPLCVQLAKLGQPLRRVAMSINLEFRGLDKFMSELGGTLLVVSDSWIIKCNVHTVNIIHQRDAVLNVSSADEHHFSIDGRSKQFLTINVTSINKDFPSFTIRLNSMQYSQLREKIQNPIREARNIVIHQSVSDRFITAFTEQVQRNGVYRIPPGSPIGLLSDQPLQPLEPCIGCLQVLPQVKLQKMCADSMEGRCRQCFCRPLWCMSCMSKWLAARQDQAHPEQWMSSTAPCPMCRAVFCMLDVLRLEEPAADNR